MNRRDAFLAFSRFLEEEDIRYVVVGNTDSYPDEIGSDVDIVVHPGDFRKLRERIPTVSRIGLRPVQVFRHEIVAYYYVLSFESEDGRPGFLMPDICSDYCRHGIRLIPAETMLEGSTEAKEENGSGKGFRIPRPEAEFLYYLEKKVGKGALSDAQYRHLCSCWLAGGGNSGTLLNSVLSQEAVRRVDASIRTGNPSALISLFPILRREFRQHGSRTLGMRFLELFRRINRVLHPTGLVVSIPDTCPDLDAFWKELVGFVSPAFRSSARIYGENPGFWELFKMRCSSTIVGCPKSLAASFPLSLLVDFEPTAPFSVEQTATALLDLLAGRFSNRF